MSQSYYSGSEADTERYSPRTTIKSPRSTKKYPWEISPPKLPVPRLLTPELPVPRLVPEDEFKLEMALKNAKKKIKKHTSLYPKGSVQTNLKKKTGYGRVLANLKTERSKKLQDLVTKRHMDSYREDFYDGNTSKGKKRNTAKKSKKRKRKTNKAKGKGNKITKKQTKNKCPTRQKRKTTWIVQNSRRYINAFKRTKIPGEIFNFNKIIQVMEEAMLDGGYWIVQWKFNRNPGKYGHYFLSFDDEYPLDVKAKNKNIHTANIGGYKKSKTRKRNRKRRSRRTRK